MIIVIALLAALFYIGSPLKVKLVLLLINLVLPDFIPFVDEVIMITVFIIHLIKKLNVVAFLVTHYKKIIVVAISVLAAFLILNTVM